MKELKKIVRTWLKWNISCREINAVCHFQYYDVWKRSSWCSERSMYIAVCALCEVGRRRFVGQIAMAPEMFILAHRISFLLHYCWSLSRQIWRIIYIFSSFLDSISYFHHFPFFFCYWLPVLFMCLTYDHSSPSSFLPLLHIVSHPPIVLLFLHPFMSVTNFVPYSLSLPSNYRPEFVSLLWAWILLSGNSRDLKRTVIIII
jgi:hypothetical protein